MNKVAVKSYRPRRWNALVERMSFLMITHSTKIPNILVHMRILKIFQPHA